MNCFGRISVAVTAIVLMSSSFSSAAGELIETPAVDGVTLGSTLGTVTQRLGKPRKTVDLGAESEVGVGECRELRYAGVTVFVSRGPQEKEFNVYELRVTSPKRSLSNGLKVGLRREDVHARVGQAEGSQTEENGDETLVYLLRDRDGRLAVRLHRGRVSCLSLAAEGS